jgi:lysine-N-methylase
MAHEGAASAFCYPEPVPMRPQYLQARAYHAFRCIGADCEDTCCTGWIVNIDKLTYQAYQGCGDPNLGPRLRTLVTINTASTSNDTYARVALSGPDCPFLSEGLCGIQQKLGETYLSIMCSRYPRVMNLVDNVVHRSLDLSCPEAARLLLLDPKPMGFDGDEGPLRDPRMGHLAALSTGDDGDFGKPYRYYREIRDFFIWLLQYRAYPIGKRLVILALLCDRLHEMTEAGLNSQTLEILEGIGDAVHRNLFDESLRQHRVQPAAQLEIVLDLIVARITAEFTAPRFLACYREFMQGIEWTSKSSMDDIAQRYASACSRYYAPFLGEHEYMLENYLVSYVHRTLFPLGPRESNSEPGIHGATSSIREQCLMMMVYYAIIQTVLIGLAGYRKVEFGPVHAIQAMQSATKVFEHSLAFPGRALEILAKAGVKTAADMAVLIRN